MVRIFSIHHQQIKQENEGVTNSVLLMLSPSAEDPCTMSIFSTKQKWAEFYFSRFKIKQFFLLQYSTVKLMRLILSMSTAEWSDGQRAVECCDQIKRGGRKTHIEPTVHRQSIYLCCTEYRCSFFLSQANPPWLVLNNLHLEEYVIQ